MDLEDHIKSTLRDFNIEYNRQQRRGPDSTAFKKKKAKVKNQTADEIIESKDKEEVDNA